MCMNRTRFGTVAAVVLALACQGPAFAQQAPSAPAAGAPADAAPAGAAPASPPAAVPVPDVAEPEPSPSHLAAGRAVVLASGMKRSFDPMVSQLMEQIPLVLTRTRPDLSKDLVEVLKQLQPEFEKKEDDIIDIAAHIYARQMSEEELKQTAAFFESPVGQKYVEAQPAMLDQLVVAMQSWTQQISTFMMLRVRQEMNKKGHQF